MRCLTAFCVVMICALICMAAALSVQAAIVYVDQSATSGADDGSSWADAYLDLQSALGVAVSGDSIWVAEGTYKPTSGLDRFATFQLKNNVALYGGFSGTEMSLSARNLSVNETILSGDIGVPGNDADNSYHIVDGSGRDSTAVLDGFTITKGYADGTDPYDSGAGMYINTGNPTVVNVIFVDNHADNYGGGMHVDNGQPSVTNIIFMNNSAYNGGGMSNYNLSHSIITNCSFANNSAYYGGGMNNLAIGDGFPIIVNSIFWGNSATEGNEIHNGISIPRISYSLIEGSGGSGSWDGNLGTDEGNNIDENPVFVNVSGGNLHLSSLASPAFNAGNNLAPNLSATDLDGNPRIMNETIDMGAYEFQATCPPDTILYVDASATGAGDGTSWVDAIPELRGALEWAPSCSGVTEIWVAAGTYKPTADTDRDATFHLLTGVAVYGGFAGGETSLSERDWATNVTILSGDIGDAGDDTDNSYHVVTGSGTNSTAVLDGFVITGGYADSGGGWPGTYGGGMLNNSGSPTVANVFFSGNHAYDSGGGMYNFDNSNPTVTNVVFVGNSTAASGSGGAGTANNNSAPLFVNVTFSQNDAGSGVGGGIANYQSNPSLVNTILWDNSAPAGGDEIYNTESTPVISYSLIKGSGGSSSWDTSLGTDGGNNIDADPLFVDALAANLRLIPVSLAVDAGLNDYIPGGVLKDLDGNPRIVDGTVDMGAYESQATCVPGTILYVDAGATGDKNGTSWVNAFPELRYAFEWAAACSGVTEIWVAAGTYMATEATDRAVSFELVNGVGIYGGFAGGENYRDERDWQANETILSGDIGAVGDASDNSYHVVKSTGTDATTVLDGFTITGGNANASVTELAPDLAVRSDTRDSKPSLSGPPVNGSRSDMAWIDTHGGGLYNNGGSPTLANLIITDNYAFDGGGLYNDSGSPAMTNIEFKDNSGIWGGAIHNYDNSSPILANVTFWNGSADFGSGIYNNWSDPYLVNTSFSYNSAYRGGGIYNNMSDPFIVNTILWGDTATSEGNEIYNADGTPQISYSIIEGSGGSTGWDTDLGTDGGSNLDADPLFADASTGILRPLGGSPAIDAGDDSALYLPATDLDGNSRILGTAIDIGAHEYPCPPGTILYVDADATGSDEGSSWTDAFTELSSALRVAQFCSGVSEIWVAEGTYKPAASLVRTSSFQLLNNVAIYGGFNGTETSVSERDWKTHPTILSGDIGVVADSTDNSYHVVVCSGTDATAVLDGFTITGGYANGDGQNGAGGGVYNIEGSPTLINLVVQDNFANSYGGGMYNFNNSCPVIINAAFAGNYTGSTGGGGAGMCNSTNSNSVLTNVVFRNNVADSDYGGAINNYSSNPILTNVSFTNNRAGRGGGMYSNSSDPVLTNVILWNDSATTSGNEINNSNGATPVISYSLIEGSGGSDSWNTSLGTDGGNNIDADPLFVDGPGGDLHLGTPSSPAVNAGDTTAVPAGITIDLEGNPRVAAEIVDMGAYEYPCLPGPVVYVDVDAIGGGKNGSSWSDAFTDLRRALEWSSCGSVHEIWVADGTYLPTAGTDRTVSFELSDSIVVYGGFAGGETDVSQRDWETNVAILSGDIGVVANSSDNSYHVVTSGMKPGDWKPVTLDGFTVQNGFADGTGYARCGAGMSSHGSAMIRNTTFTYNQATVGGGFYASEGPDVHMVNVDFMNNVVDSAGGGIYADANSIVDISNSSFFANTANYGGGICCGEMAHTMLDSVAFDGNVAMSYGGAICKRGDLTFSNSSLINNEAMRGGGIYNFGIGEFLIVDRITASNNHALSTGGVICNGMNANASIFNSLFSLNWSDSAGGAIFNNVGSQQDLANVLLQNNSSGWCGGGIYNGSSTHVTMTNVAAANNIGGEYGGGIFNEVNSQVTLINLSAAGNQANYGGGIYNTNISYHVYVNSILWGNVSFSGANEIYNDYSDPQISYSLIYLSGGSGGGWDTNLGTDLGHNIDGDPLFANYISGDLHLLVGSPAIDAGDNSANTWMYDLDGNSRVVAGIIDMGAYEFQDVPSTAAAPESVIFNQAPMSQTTCDTIYIINEGGAACTISGIYGCTSSPFSVDTSMTDHVIAPGDTAMMMVCVTPSTTDPDSDLVTIVSDAWNSSTTVKVKLQNVIVSGAGDMPRPLNIVAISPNPFNPSTTVFFTLPSAQPVTATIWSVTGARVRTLAVDKRYGPGSNQLHWDGYTDRGSMAASGVYFIRIQTPLGTRTGRAVLLK